MSRPHRPPQPEVPDAAQRLLAAVVEGDSLAARRLQPVLGSTAMHWLREQLSLALPLSGKQLAPFRARPAAASVVGPLVALPVCEATAPPAPAPDAERRLRSWLSDLPQAG